MKRLLLILSAFTIFSSSVTAFHQEITLRIEYFTNLDNPDSTQCCLQDLAKILDKTPYGLVAAPKLIEASFMREPESIISHLGSLPFWFKQSIGQLIGLDQLIPLLTQRIASNGKVDCSAIRKQLQETRIKKRNEHNLILAAGRVACKTMAITVLTACTTILAGLLTYRLRARSGSTVSIGAAASAA